MYPMHPDLRGGDRRDGHALDGRADVRQDVQGHGAKLPAITQYVVDASDCIVAYGLYIVGGLVAASWASRSS